MAKGGKYVHDSVHWEEGLRVPFVMRAPGRFAQGTVDHANHSMIDLAPTVLDLAHIAYLPERFDGQSLLRPTDEQRKHYFTCWFEDLCVGYVQGHTKLVFIPMLDSWAVYDLVRDPKEIRPHIDPPEWRSRVRQVAAWYDERRFRTEGLSWPAKSLFAGRWRCGVGRDKCEYAVEDPCKRNLDPAAITSRPGESGGERE